MIAAIRDAKAGNTGKAGRDVAKVGVGVKILLVDHEDSFVHTLANYFRQTGATVTTVRSPVADEVFDKVDPTCSFSRRDGQPEGLRLRDDDQEGAGRKLPIFGVCLGLQALAEAYGGELRQLAIPMHGKPSRVRVLEAGTVFSGLAKEGHRWPLSLDLRRSRHARP